MRLINANASIEGIIDGIALLKHIEKCGRTCYKSEDKITDESAMSFAKMIIKNGHESVIEHSSLSFRIVCDRGVSHEIVRHRIASYSQESTRYCNYSEAKFGSELTFIKPCFWEESSKEFQIWSNEMQHIEKSYLSLIELGARPEEARSILPNSLKTELVMTMNLRELRHFLKLRTSMKAHPQMREIALYIHKLIKENIPVLFDDIADYSSNI